MIILKLLMLDIGNAFNLLIYSFLKMCIDLVYFLNSNNYDLLLIYFLNNTKNRNVGISFKVRVYYGNHYCWRFLRQR